MLYHKNGPIKKEIKQELSKYVKVSYRQLIEDWNKPVDDVYTEQSIGAKRCSVYEFGNDTYADQYFSTWVTDSYEFDLFCPDLLAHHYDLFDKNGAMLANSLIFRVEKCEDTAESSSFCKDDKIIEEFVKDLTVQIWIIDSSIDMRYLHKESLKRH